jgi:hypothetical protein
MPNAFVNDLTGQSEFGLVFIEPSLDPYWNTGPPTTITG